MGKRAASGRGGIVIAQEVTKLVEAKKDISGPEVIAALKDKFPGIKFNEASVQVSFANVRKKLGLSPAEMGRQCALMKAKLADRAALFDECYQAFFFVRKYPENAKRFILSFELCFQEANGA